MYTVKFWKVQSKVGGKGTYMIYDQIELKASIFKCVSLEKKLTEKHLIKKIGS